MTPREVDAMTDEELEAFTRFALDDLRDQRRQAARRARRGR
jgi:hypothetical protein